MFYYAVRAYFNYERNFRPVFDPCLPPARKLNGNRTFNKFTFTVSVLKRFNPLHLICAYKIKASLLLQ